MKKLRSIIMTIALAVATVGTPLTLSVENAAAQTCSGSVSECITQGTTSAGSGGGPTLEQQIKNVTNVLLFILGGIAVIMLIIGGIRYTTSNGDASRVKAAKDTILYAVIGVVVALVAYAIVNFVVTSFK